MPCETMENCRRVVHPTKFITRLACILEAHESTRLRMRESVPNYHEDQNEGKRQNSLQHYNLVHKFTPVPQAMKITAARAAVDKEWDKLETILAWNLTEVRSEKELIDETRTSGAKSSFCIIDGHMSSEKVLNWRQNTKNTKVELYSVVIL